MISQQTALLNDVPQGLYIVNVVSGSPAEEAGVLVGDIIYKIDGNSVSSDSESLSKSISDKKPSDNILLEIWRNGEVKNISVALGEFSQ
ncbi:MAG: Serine protease Do [Candidatus Woesebacteria bacterium GW2011_GWE1_41_24]|nr:MAG: Serine protease Do [Candidatus Woesebacteria bacterium GW2011_GWE1_41_24]